jgi:XTP/dITP diphosphohydrolase
MKRLVVASNNSHKLVEIGRVLKPLGFEVVPLSEFPEIPDPPETGNTFEANSLQKARFVFKITGLPTIADDSGLEVDALNGAPGVYSKRYTPEATADANNRKLLIELAGKHNRSGRFVCALSLVTDKGERVVRGTVEGVIAETESGEQGFGYDPLFMPNDAPGRSMAQLPPEQKDAISHRGRALLSLPIMISEIG